MVKKRDIYHKDHPPPLARKSRSHSKSLPPSSAGQRFAPVPEARIPFDGFHQDGDLKRRRRRRRGRKSTPENSVGKWLAWGLGGTLLLYLVAWSFIELRIKKPAPTPEATQSVAVQKIEPVKAELSLNMSGMINASRSGERAISNVRNMIDRKEYGQAEVQLTKLQETLPNHTDVLYLQAQLDFIQKNPLETVKHLGKLLSQDPDHIQARLLLAQSLYASDNFQQAIDAAQWTLNGDNYIVEAHLLIADSHQQLGNMTQAISHLRKAYNQRPNDLLIANDLATAYMDADQIDRALTIYNSLLLKPEVDSVTFFNLAICYAKKGNKEKILETLNKAEDKFGLRYISAWVSNPYFDEYRNQPEFSQFTDQGKRPPEPASPKA